MDGKEYNIENIGRGNSYIGRGVSRVQYSFYESNILNIVRLTINYLLYSHSTSHTSDTTIQTAVAEARHFEIRNFLLPDNDRSNITISVVIEANNHVAHSIT